MPAFKKDWSSVISKMKEQHKGGKEKDERFYMPEFKEDGTAKATIRFLPSPDVDMPFVEKYSHFFKGVGGVFIDMCPTTFNLPCPVCEDNTRLWNTNEDDVRKRNSLRKLNYFSNVLVVKDEKNPSNEGKVFLFRMGIKLYEKVLEALNEEKIPFDEDEGHNFILKIKKTKVGNDILPNYDASVFIETPTSLVSILGSSNKVLEMMSTRYKIGELRDKTQLKSYNELKDKFIKVMGEVPSQPSQPHSIQKQQQQQQQQQQNKSIATPATTVSNDDIYVDDNDKDFFENMDVDA